MASSPLQRYHAICTPRFTVWMRKGNAHLLGNQVVPFFLQKPVWQSKIFTKTQPCGAQKYKNIKGLYYDRSPWSTVLKCLGALLQHLEDRATWLPNHHCQAWMERIPHFVCWSQSGWFPGTFLDCLRYLFWDLVLALDLSSQHHVDWTQKMLEMWGLKLQLNCKAVWVRVLGQNPSLKYLWSPCDLCKRVYWSGNNVGLQTSQLGPIKLFIDTASCKSFQSNVHDQIISINEKPSPHL